MKSKNNDMSSEDKFRNAEEVEMFPDGYKDGTGYIDDSEKDDFEEYAIKALGIDMSKENSENISIKSLVIFLREKNNKMSELIKSIGVALNRIDEFKDDDSIKEKDGSVFTMKDALVTLNNDYKRNLERIEAIEKFLGKAFK